MRTFLGIVLCLSVVDLPFVRGKCAWPFEQVVIDDTEINKEIFNFESDDDFEFGSWEVTLKEGNLEDAVALSYFQHSQQDKTLSIKTTDNFGNLNNDAYTDGKNQLSISLSISLTCAEASEPSTLLIVITNTNQNAPGFTQESYSYSLPMPIMPRTDFSLYGGDIIATDIDFSTNQITFSVDPSDFTVTSSKTDNKTFQAVFSANRILRFTTSQVYTLTATDSGSPAKTTPVTITLNIDPATGLDSPSFSSVYYSYNYTGGDTPALVLTSGEMVILSDKAGEAIYALSGDYSDQFEVVFTNSSKTFTLALKSDGSLPEEVTTQTILTLSYTTDVSTNTAILITIVKDETVPEFSSNYYVGTYDIDTNKISWQEDIKITDATTVELSGGKSDLFQLNSTTFELTPIDTLSSSDFDDNSNLFLTLIASSSNSEVRATVVISLPTPDELKFDSAYYYGAYSIENEKGVVSLDADIGFSDVTDFTGITIVVDDSYSSNFKIEVDSAKWKVTVLVELNKTVIDANSELAIPITATKIDQSAISYAILILKLPEKVEIQFASSFYTASYLRGSEPNTATVVLDSDITIDGADINNIIITPVGYTDNFEIEYNSTTSHYEITVTTTLDASIIASNTQLIISLTATETDSSATATTVLVLKLPAPSLNFESNFYAAEYIVDALDQGSVQLTDNDIKITGADPDQITFTFKDYNDNFEMEYDSASFTYNIKVNKNLDSSTLALESPLLITITATEVDSSATANTVLVLKLPEPSLNFESNFYAAEYIVDTSDQGSVQLTDNKIKITGGDPDKITFTIKDYSENFEMEYDPASTSYNIKVNKNLDSTTLALESPLLITITAAETDASTTATTVLVLKLPVIPSSLSFENMVYAAEYIVDTSDQGSVQFTDNKIKITGGDPDKITFTIKDYSENFEMEYDTASTSYSIKVNRNLDSTTLALESPLLITITATETDTSATANTVLALKLPVIPSSLSFENTVYAAEYIVDTSDQGSVQLTDNKIKITGGDPDKITFTIKDYSENFEMEYDPASISYNIQVNKNLDSTTLALESPLLITITATETDASTTATTVLVLKLPVIPSSLSFENTVYAAEYIVDTSDQGSVQFTDNKIKITGGDPDKITFTIKDYSENFEMEYDTASTSYNIKVNRNLDSTTLALESPLLITITATETDTSATANTVLALKLPVIPSSLSFENTVYAAEYIVDTSDQGSVQFTDNKIKITGGDPDKITFTIKDYSENFEMEYDPVSTSYNIKVNKNLDSTTLALESPLLITITATETDASTTAATVLVLKLPVIPSSLSFENSVYAAQYTVDTSDQGSVQFIDNKIKITGGDPDKITFIIKDYSENFEMEYDPVSTSYNIKVNKNLDSTTLALESPLLITITATETDASTTAATVLVLKLPVIPSSLSFENSVYAAQYTVDTSDQGSVQFIDNKIKITGGDPDKITFIIKDYSENFEMEYDPASTSYNIKVNKNLDTTTLALESPLLITITATETDTSATANTVLALKLPVIPSSLSFDNTVYAAEYIVDTSDQGSVQFTDNKIKITGGDPDKITFIIKDYSENFEMEYDPASTSYNIKVNKNLDTTTLALESPLLITITATETDTSATANTVLALKLPVIPSSLSFDNTVYAAEYIVDTSDQGSVQFTDNKIKITGGDPDKITFTIKDYSENFEMEYDSASTSYNIKVNKNLDSTTLALESPLLITITATETDASTTAATVLVLKLPVIPSSLSFENSVYAAEYILDTSNQGSVQFTDNKIKITGGDPDKITFIIKDYSENFEMEYDPASTSYNIKVNKNLDTTTLALESPLLITITATETDTSATANTVLALKLPVIPSSLSFDNTVYAAEYIVDTSDQGSVQFTDNKIKITGGDPDKITFIIKDYSENFEMEYDSASTSYNIKVNKNLDSTTLALESPLLITITATETDASTTAATVLVLKLPVIPSSLSFENSVYAAEYIVDTSDQGRVQFTDNKIKITGGDPDKITFIIKDYSENFEMEYDPASTSYNIKVNKNLDTTKLALESPLLITITATETDTSATANTVLALKLPVIPSSLSFDNTVYAAEYIVDTSDQGSVQFTDNKIKITGGDPDKITFIIKDFSENFEMEYDSASTSYNIKVNKNLGSTTLALESPLLITITATETDASTTAATVLVLKLPVIPSSLSFEKSVYAAEYIVDTSDQGSVQFTDNKIKITGGDPDKITFTIKDYSENFEMEYDPASTSYNIKVNRNLDSTTLALESPLLITITATETDASTTAATVLVLKLPVIPSSLSFENSVYAAEYIVDTSDQGSVQFTDNKIKITGGDPDKITFTIKDYSENFEMEYDSASTSYNIKVNKNLDSTTLALESPLLITITATETDASTTAATVLILKLPVIPSSLSFENSVYAAEYIVDTSDQGSVQFTDNKIKITGGDPDKITFTFKDYSENFEMEYDAASTSYNIKVNKNLDSTTLALESPLLITITATETDASTTAATVLALKLPVTASSLNFDNKFYAAEYVVDASDQGSVQLPDNKIKITGAGPEEITFTLKDYDDYFGMDYDSASLSYNIKVNKNLDSVILALESPLLILITATKTDPSATASTVLALKLPEQSSLNFVKKYYSAEYSVDSTSKATVKITNDDIKISGGSRNNIQFSFEGYDENFDMVYDSGTLTCNINVIKNLDSSVLDNNAQLLITITAATTDASGTTVLALKLPQTTIMFEEQHYTAEYSLVSESEAIVSLDKYIVVTGGELLELQFSFEGSEYSTNFQVHKRQDETYDIEVTENLPQDALNTSSSIVLTLVASTEVEGMEGYATLVINLPKIPREPSVHFKDEKILYSGTYENGTFKSPSITIETDSTDDDLIGVVITNDLEVDNKYFSPTYKNKVLTVEVDGLPEDILKKYTVIPLKLAITDKSTRDTVNAVLNVNINYTSNANGDAGDSDTDKGLLIAVIILAILLIAVIIATVLLWYFKIRNAKYVKMEEEEVEKPAAKPTNFIKNLNRQTSTSVPSNSSLRRPTGLPLGFGRPESPTEQASDDFEPLPFPVLVSENEKKVIFDDNVQNINDNEFDNDNTSGTLQNVGDRRPTQYVFGNPMGTVPDSPTDDIRRESSDYDEFDPEKKKTVLFDDNVERMHIDVPDDEGNDTEGEEETDDVRAENERKRFRAELEVELEKQFPNERFKETL